MGDRLYGRSKPPYFGEKKYRVVCSALYEEPSRDCPGRANPDAEAEAIAAWNTRAAPLPARDDGELVACAKHEIAVMGKPSARTTDALLARIAALNVELERRAADGIHTCHDQCQRVACVLRRENDALNAEVARGNAALETAIRFNIDAEREVASLQAKLTALGERHD
jgi:hypothetical protein